MFFEKQYIFITAFGFVLTSLSRELKCSYFMQDATTHESNCQKTALEMAFGVKLIVHRL
jgi:hypothetical protein